MQKKILSLLILIMMCLLVACGGEVFSNDTQKENSQENLEISDSEMEEGSEEEEREENNSAEMEQQTEEAINTIELLEDVVEQEIENWIDGLYAEWKVLETEISSYDIYKKNLDKIETFYNKLYEETKTMCNKLRGYSIQYADIIINSDIDITDMYSEAEIIYDSIYNDAGDEIYDEIYNGILDDMYDAFYSGVIRDAYTDVPYAEYSDISSDEYNMNVDTRSDIYDECLDMRSDVYDFALDFRGELFDRDLEKAKEEIADFKEDIEN